jgi:SAM-dependent methyltransferase
MKVHTGTRSLRGRLRSFKRRLESAGYVPTSQLFELGDSAAAIHRTRAAIARRFLRGDGLEIGALHQPLRVPPSARVKYVDRMTSSDLRSHYKELADHALVEPDIVDDGERLATLGDNTQDFVIANHFLEHCQNPILALQNLFRVLRPGGVLYLAVPDKRFTFDVDRPCTSLDHLLRDFTDGPEWSRLQHFEEWSRLVNKRVDEAAIQEEAHHLSETGYSIHFHVWGAAEILEFMTVLQRFVRHELELVLRNGPETVLILRKPPQ